MQCRGLVVCNNDPLIGMMTSSNGNIFRVTGHLRGEFTGLQWIPRTKASDAELWCFFDLRLNNDWVNNREAGDIRRYHAHYGVIVMDGEWCMGNNRTRALHLFFHLNLTHFHSATYMRQWIGLALVQIKACRQDIISTNAGFIVNWSLGINRKEMFLQNTIYFIQEHAYENTVCEIAAILSRGDELMIYEAISHTALACYDAGIHPVFCVW